MTNDNPSKKAILSFGLLALSAILTSAWLGILTFVTGALPIVDTLQKVGFQATSSYVRLAIVALPFGLLLLGAGSLQIYREKSGGLQTKQLSLKGILMAINGALSIAFGIIALLQIII